MKNWKIKNLFINLAFLLITCFVMLLIIKYRTGLYFSAPMIMKMFLLKAYWVILILTVILEAMFISLGFRTPENPLAKKVPYAYGVLFLILIVIAALPIERWI